ncbi:carboxylesterase family protein [Streptosporangium sp. NPDC048047]|uniref:carboxylesterase/lipase family protein n=1 Tax=Streptosporangium sp. NPDC048047 TaxID=3155748 RepID=UPI0034207AD8
MFTEIPLRRLVALIASGCLTATTCATQTATAQAAIAQTATAQAATRVAGTQVGTVQARAVRTGRRSSVVRLDSGRIRGLDDGTVRTYAGIPFARPPVGALRWKDPVRVAPWKGVADATRPGAQCPQTASGKRTGAEDCLYLNVTVPSRPSRGPRPVMVWLHGGGYITGGGDLYGARRLADRGDVIVVTPNYRLGAFGYLSLPKLAGSGTFGLADQVEALRWVRRNAAAFGGDRDDVTLSGQSAGGMSTCALLTSPALHGLAGKAIIQSGSCMLDWVSGTYVPIPGIPPIRPYSSLKDSEGTGLAAAEQLGCPEGKELACLRAKPVSELMKVNDSFASNLAYGTPLLPLDPARALREGRFARIPVMSGGNRNEASGFVAGVARAGYPVTAESYPKLIEEAFGEHADAVAREYPLSEYASPGQAWAALSTDRAWSCPTLAGDRAMAAGTTVYAYEFADEHAPDIGGATADFPLGAQHASELPYLFDLGGRPWSSLTAEQWRLAERMIDYWTSFARTGRPRAVGAPAWPAFTGRGGSVLSLRPDSQGGIGPARYSEEHRCGFWDGLGG